MARRSLEGKIKGSETMSRSVNTLRRSVQRLKKSMGGLDKEATSTSTVFKVTETSADSLKGSIRNLSTSSTASSRTLKSLKEKVNNLRNASATGSTTVRRLESSINSIPTSATRASSSLLPVSQSIDQTRDEATEALTPLEAYKKQISSLSSTKAIASNQALQSSIDEVGDEAAESAGQYATFKTLVGSSSVTPQLGSLEDFSTFRNYLSGIDTSEKTIGYRAKPRGFRRLNDLLATSKDEASNFKSILSGIHIDNSSFDLSDDEDLYKKNLSLGTIGFDSARDKLSDFRQYFSDTINGVNRDANIRKLGSNFEISEDSFTWIGKDLEEGQEKLRQFRREAAGGNNRIRSPLPSFIDRTVEDAKRLRQNLSAARSPLSRDIDLSSSWEKLRNMSFSDFSSGDIDLDNIDTSSSFQGTREEIDLIQKHFNGLDLSKQSDVDLNGYKQQALYQERTERSSRKTDSNFKSILGKTSKISSVLSGIEMPEEYTVDSLTEGFDPNTYRIEEGGFSWEGENVEQAKADLRSFRAEKKEALLAEADNNLLGGFSTADRYQGKLSEIQLLREYIDDISDMSLEEFEESFDELDVGEQTDLRDKAWNREQQRIKKKRSKADDIDVEAEIDVQHYGRDPSFLEDIALGIKGIREADTEYKKSIKNTQKANSGLIGSLRRKNTRLRKAKTGFFSASNMADNFTDSLKVMSNAGSGLSEILSSYGSISTNVGPFNLPLSKVVRLLPIVVGSMTSLASAIGGVATAAIGAGGGLAALFGGGLLQMGESLSRQFESIESPIQGVMHILKEFKDAAFEAIRPLVQVDFSGFTMEVLSGTLHFLGDLAQMVADMSDELLAFADVLGATWWEFEPTILESFRDLTLQLLPVLESLFERLGGWLPKAFDTMGKHASQLGPLIGDMWDAIKPFIGALMDLALGGMKFVLPFLTGLIKSFQWLVPIMKGVGSVLGWLGDTFKPVIEGIGYLLGTLAQLVGFGPGRLAGAGASKLIGALGLKKAIPLSNSLLKTLTKIRQVVGRARAGFIAVFNTINALGLDGLINALNALASGDFSLGFDLPKLSDLLDFGGIDWDDFADDFEQVMFNTIMGIGDVLGTLGNVVINAYEFGNEVEKVLRNMIINVSIEGVKLGIDLLNPLNMFDRLKTTIKVLGKGLFGGLVGLGTVIFKGISGIISGATNFLSGLISKIPGIDKKTNMKAKDLYGPNGMVQQSQASQNLEANYNKMRNKNEKEKKKQQQQNQEGYEGSSGDKYEFNFNGPVNGDQAVKDAIQEANSEGNESESKRGSPFN